MPKEDRRVSRTKRRLKAALLELIDERGYAAITISDLTERADVGRSTFYSHYDSKEDLLFAGFDRWILTIADETPSPGSSANRRFTFSLPLLRHIAERPRFFEATMVRAGEPRIRRQVTALLVERVERELEAGGEAADRARAHGIVGAFLGLVSWWLSEGRGRPAEEIDGAFQRVVGL